MFSQKYEIELKISTITIEMLILLQAIGFIVFSLLDISQANSNAKTQDELIFAQVIYRHGNRTIFMSYENDPYKSDTFWPEGYSQLTNTGKQTQYELGKYLRRRYKKLLGPDYSPNSIYIQSSNTSRTLVSAQSNAAGLLSPSDNQIFDESFNFQPIPIHTIPINEDYLIYQNIPCPKIDKLQDEYIKSHQIKELLNRYSGLRTFLETHSGSKVQNVIDFIPLYDTLKIEHLRGLPLPEWAEKALKHTNGALEYFAARFFESFTHTTEMKKAKAGFLIKEIFDRFKNKTLHLLNPDRSLWIYSAHDNTIINVLNALNVYQYHIPPFAASVYFELYKHGQEYYVQLFYRTDDSEFIPPIEIPNCGIKCPLDKLFELYKVILPTKKDTYASLCRL